MLFSINYNMYMSFKIHNNIYVLICCLHNMYMSCNLIDCIYTSLKTYNWMICCFIPNATWHDNGCVESDCSVWTGQIPGTRHGAAKPLQLTRNRTGEATASARQRRTTLWTDLWGWRPSSSSACICGKGQASTRQRRLCLRFFYEMLCTPASDKVVAVLGSDLSAKVHHQNYSSQYKFSVTVDLILCPAQSNQFCAVVDKSCAGPLKKCANLQMMTWPKCTRPQRRVALWQPYRRIVCKKSSNVISDWLPSTGMRIVSTAQMRWHDVQ